MAEQEDVRPHPEAGRQTRALAAAGIVGTYERDHRRHTVCLCRGAADLMAGDPDLAWQDLTPEKAMANVYIDDVAWVREQVRRAASAPGVYIRELRVRGGEHGIRRVLMRGRTYAGSDGRPSHTLGVIIDISDIETDGRQRFGPGPDALDSAAQHGVAAFEAIETTGIRGLLAPARTLLMAIGREIARRISGRPNVLH